MQKGMSRLVTTTRPVNCCPSIADWKLLPVGRTAVGGRRSANGRQLTHTGDAGNRQAFRPIPGLSNPARSTACRELPAARSRAGLCRTEKLVVDALVKEQLGQPPAVQLGLLRASLSANL